MKRSFPWPVACWAFMLGALLAASGLRPMTCEPIPGGKMARVIDGGIEVYSAEQCEDGTMRMRPLASYPFEDSPSPEEGPKVSI